MSGSPRVLKLASGDSASGDSDASASEENFTYAPVVLLSICITQLVLYAVDGTVDSLILTSDSSWDVYVGYAFSHASWLHVIGNVTTLIVGGISLELVDGFRVLPVWLAAVIGGAIAHRWVEPDVGLLGGSAGVFGVITAHFADIALNYSDIPQWPWKLLTYIALCVPPIAYAILEEEGIAHAAHAGGAIAGLIAGFVFLTNFHANSRSRAVQFIVPVVIVLSVVLLLL